MRLVFCTSLLDSWYLSDSCLSFLHRSVSFFAGAFPLPGIEAEQIVMTGPVTSGGGSGDEQVGPFRGGGGGLSDSQWLCPFSMLKVETSIGRHAQASTVFHLDTSQELLQHALS